MKDVYPSQIEYLQWANENAKREKMEAKNRLPKLKETIGSLFLKMKGVAWEDFKMAHADYKSTPDYLEVAERLSRMRQSHRNTVNLLLKEHTKKMRKTRNALYYATQKHNACDPSDASTNTVLVLKID